jgi:hypothetical protein
MLINYTFTDWNKLRSIIEKDKGYPPHRMMSVPVTLMPIPETEKFVASRTQAISVAMKMDETQLPECTKEELWQGDTTYKYYKDPSKKNRATKNFDNFAEAQIRLNKDGGGGVIDIVRGEAKFCNYCPGVSICSQAKQLVADGLLTLED